MLRLEEARLICFMCLCLVPDLFLCFAFLWRQKLVPELQTVRHSQTRRPKE